MKMFALLLVFTLLPFVAFAGGEKEASSDEMMEKEMESTEMMSDYSMEKDDAMMASDDEMGMMLIEPYPDFPGLEKARMMAADKPTVLFFYATWCPTCQEAKKALQARAEELDGINLYIVDYDNSDDLQKKYGVTYQHTFVQIDEQGMAVQKWNGGAVDEILMKIEAGDMM